MLHGDDNFECSECPKIFKYPQGVKAHVYKFHAHLVDKITKRAKFLADLKKKRQQYLEKIEKEKALRRLQSKELRTTQVMKR